MNQEYKYKKMHLDKEVIRHILKDELPASMYGFSVQEVQDRIVKYHEQCGGKPASIKDISTAVYNVLDELIESGKFQDSKGSKFRYYRSVENDDNSKDGNILKELLGVVTGDCSILHKHIETLKRLIEELEKRKSELQEIQDKYEFPYK